MSWLLVLANHRDPENGRAAYLYLVMAAIGTGELSSYTIAGLGLEWGSTVLAVWLLRRHAAPVTA